MPRAMRRRGIVVPLLYAPDSRPGLDSRITVWTKTGGFTFRISDLEKGSILIPERGVFMTKAGSGQTGPAICQGIGGQESQKHSADDPRTSRGRLVEGTDAGGSAVDVSCGDGRQAVSEGPRSRRCRWNCPIPDWTAAWRAASFQLKGPHMWGGLAFEVGRVAHEMDMIGLQRRGRQGLSSIF